MFSEKFKIVPVAQEINLAGTVYTHSLYMKDILKVTYVFLLGTLGTASPTFTVLSAADDNTYTTAIRFNYAYGGAALGTATAGSTTSSDVLAAWTSAATLLVDHATKSNFMLVVEVDPADMNSDLDHDWLACRFVNGSSGTGTASGIAIVEYRYPGNRSDTVLAA